MENKILASVNGKPITQSDVDIFMQSLGEQRAAQFNNEAGREQLLNELINQNLFLAEAVAENLQETDEYKVEMARMQEVLLTQVNINRTINSAVVEEEDAKAFFAANAAKYNTPESATTSHILVETEEKCNEIYTKLMNNEIEFAAAATEFSSCPSSQKGGELGSYPRGQMVPEYDNAAFAMEVGEVSKPVKTQFGFHIIKLNDKTVATESKFEDVMPQVMQEAKADKQRAVYMDKIEELKKAYKVEMA